MNVEVFDPIPERLLERLVSFSTNAARSGWREVYTMMNHLSERYPGTVFRDAPYFYLDLKSKRAGLLFVEHESERLYFVYDTPGGTNGARTREHDG